ncbi:hypothetical protein [Salmonella enterica]|nr:hypothetical protein [Salmonella enterica]
MNNSKNCYRPFPTKKLLQQTFCIWKSMGLYLADYKKALLDITW